MMHMGNLYTAALPAWLAAGILEAQEQQAELSGHKLLLVGYGSGDAAETVVAKVTPNWRQAAAKIGLAKALGNAVNARPGRLRPYACMPRNGRRKRRSRSAPASPSSAWASRMMPSSTTSASSTTATAPGVAGSYKSRRASFRRGGFCFVGGPCPPLSGLVKD